MKSNDRSFSIGGAEDGVPGEPTDEREDTRFL